MFLNQFLSTSLILSMYFYSNTSSLLSHDENLKLELVQVIFRHGARTHLKCEAEFMHINETSIRPWGFKQLIKEGMKQEYEIGQMLRERYNGFLPALYEQKHVYAYSSEPERTKASLGLVLSALYPPVDEFIWNPDLKWMPIPIHSNSKALDILNQPRFCPKYKNFLAKLYNSREWNMEALKYNDTRATLSSIHGRESSIKDLFCAHSSIIVQRSLKLPLPNWYNDKLFDELHAASIFHLKTLSYNSELKKTNGGTYVRRFVENMNDTNASKGRKIYLYASHETNLHAVASFHNLTFPSGVPDYGSAIIIEKLSDANNNRYVKILIWSGNPKKLTVLKLDRCAELCPMEEYLKIVTPMLPSNDEMLCLFKTLSPKSLETILNSDTGSQKA